MDKINISVLFVDDEKILCTIYEKLIGALVQTIYIAGNGHEGLDLFKKHEPDLVITDIKMPLMSGLDMTMKIKLLKPDARIIILSAYSEANYLMRAIDIGVKVFLLKPAKNEKLFTAIREQAYEILLEKNMHYEEQRRLKAEAELLHNEKMLQAVGEVAQKLLQFGYTEKVINDTLSRLGQATQVSRVYIFENYYNDNILLTKLKHEWVAEDITPQIGNPELLQVPVDSSHFKCWTDELTQKKSISGNVRDFPPQERDVLDTMEAFSVIILPIFVQDKWFGSIGFDDCMYEHTWTFSEVNTLMTAANIIGGAIQRSQIEEQLQKLNVSLEERVRVRTKYLDSEIVERKNAEMLLRQSEEKYRLIFENSNDGIFLSIKSKIQFINPRFYELTGFYPNQLVGRSFVEFIHPDDKEKVIGIYERRLSGEKVPDSYDIRIIDTNGKARWVEIKSSVIKWENKESVLTFLIDIDARKTFEKELQYLNANLEEKVNEELKNREKQQQLFLQKSKLESLGELSAGMAHEINQPLGGLSLSLDNIIDEIEATQLTEGYLRKKIHLMFGDIERIQEIINHVRLFTREQDSNHEQVFVLSEVINKSLLLVNRLFVDHLIDLQVSIKTYRQRIQGNPYRLEQVVLNMLSNARYAVDRKYKLIGPSFQKAISIKTWTQSTNIFIEIEDNGTGIPESIINNIFDPFFTTKSEGEGTGLGLSISYGIIRDLGGIIEVKSEEGVYTKMIIILPVYSE